MSNTLLALEASLAAERRKSRRYGPPTAMGRPLSLQGRNRRQPIRALSRIECTVPGHVPRLTQPNNNACWATMYTMLYSWKSNQSYTVDAALDELGEPWRSTYINRKVLRWRDEPRFFAQTGIVAEPAMNLTLQGWLQSLRNYGPLATQVEPDPTTPCITHWVVVVAIKGDGTASGTKFTVIDPWDGQTHEIQFQKFVKIYEQVVDSINTCEGQQAPLNVQIAHWPQGARGATAQSIFPRSAFTDSPRGGTEAMSYHSSSLRTAAMSGDLPWSRFFHFPAGTAFRVDGPLSYDGTGEVVELTDSTLRFSMSMPEKSIFGMQIPQANITVAVTYSREGAGNNGSIVYNGTTYRDNNITIVTNDGRRTLRPSISIPGQKIEEISIARENDNEIDVDIRLNGRTHDFDLERISTSMSTQVTQMSMVNITHAGSYRLAYDRIESLGYGIIQPAPKRDTRQFRGDPRLQTALNTWATYIPRVSSPPPAYILTGGLYTNKTGAHGIGLAVDIDGLWWSDSNKFLAKEAPTDWHRYLRIEASLRKVFGIVLNYDYNAAHQDHWHCDLTASTRWRSVRSQIKFVQRALKEIWHENLEVDGVWGAISRGACQRAGYTLTTEGHWDRLLDDLINKPIREA